MDGRIYRGWWYDDRKSGRGEEISRDGKVFVGKWKDGQREGRGVLTHTTGFVDKGEWKAGRLKRGIMRNGPVPYDW